MLLSVCVFLLLVRFDFSRSLKYLTLLHLKGSTFAEVIEMTDIFEGSIIRHARRLDEFLNQVKGLVYP